MEISLSLPPLPRTVVSAEVASWSPRDDRVAVLVVGGVVYDPE